MTPFFAREPREIHRNKPFSFEIHMKKTFSILSISLGFCILNAQAGIPPVTITNVTDLASPNSAKIFINGTVGEAAAFTTGASTSTVYSVQMILDGITSTTTVKAPGQSGTTAHPQSPPPTASYDALLFTDVSGAPGSQLVNLGAPQSTVTSANTLATILAPANTYLAADTTYWLVLKLSSSGYQGGWQDTGTLSSSSPNGWSIASGYDSDPSTWSQTSSTSTPLFSIETVAPAPEPGTLALAGLGAAALWRFRRRG